MLWLPANSRTYRWRCFGERGCGSTHVRPLQHGPETLHAVRARHAANVLGDPVFDALVLEGKSIVGGSLVTVDGSAGSRVLDDKALQRRLVSVLSTTCRLA